MPVLAETYHWLLLVRQAKASSNAVKSVLEPGQQKSCLKTVKKRQSLLIQSFRTLLTVRNLQKCRSWGKDQEVNIIKNGFIWYKNADIYDLTVNIIDNTAILLNRITLLAVVGGREVSNDFVVTEVYLKQNGTWKLGDLSFSHLMAPPAPGTAPNR
jgi:hypothetical protein